MIIERLYQEDRPFGGPACAEIAREVSQVLDDLSKELDEDGRRKLDALSALYLRQSGLAAKDAFTQGFCTAVQLMRECCDGTSL